MSQNHFINLDAPGLSIQVKDDDNECLLNYDCKGNSNLKTTNSINNSSNQLIASVVKESKINITDKEIIIQVVKSTIFIDQDKIVLKIGDSSILMNSNSISIETDEMNIKTKKIFNVESNCDINLKSSINVKTDAGANMSSSAPTINISGDVASLKGSLSTIIG